MGATQKGNQLRFRWSKFASQMKNRTGKQCRERWANRLRPDLKKGTWTPEEDKKIIELQKEYGNQWAKMVPHMAGRCDNDIKNRWHHFRKKEGAQHPSDRKRSATKTAASKPHNKKARTTRIAILPNPSRTILRLSSQPNQMEKGSCLQQRRASSSNPNPSAARTSHGSCHTPQTAASKQSVSVPATAVSVTTLANSCSALLPRMASHTSNIKSHGKSDPNKRTPSSNLSPTNHATFSNAALSSNCSRVPRLSSSLETTNSKSERGIYDPIIDGPSTNLTPINVVRHGRVQHIESHERLEADKHLDWSGCYKTLSQEGTSESNSISTDVSCDRSYSNDWFKSPKGASSVLGVTADVESKPPASPAPVEYSIHA